MPDVYYEDLEIGDTASYGTYEVTEAEILDFANAYDPQWFHTDPDAAADSIYGGLIASGWHTAAMTMRLLVDNYLSRAAVLGAAGLESLTWPNPTRPGDELSVETEILEKRVSESDPRRGLVTSRAVTTNRDDAEKMRMVSVMLYARRDDGD